MDEQEFARRVLARINGLDPLATLAAECKVRFVRNGPIIALAPDSRALEFIQAAGLERAVVLPAIENEPPPG